MARQRKASPVPAPNCSKCQAPITPLDAFPGDLCLSCYTPIGDRLQRTMTADRLTRMWGGK
jgi:predicted amidophosphoribosyltransferase